MARKTAGRKYPYATTAARPHDHVYCPAVQAFVARAKAGLDAWGQVHALPAVGTLEQAERAKAGLYRARKHGYSIRARVIGPGGQLASGAAVADGQYVVELQVWTRAAAREYIAGEVQAGRPLAYNVLRRESA